MAELLTGKNLLITGVLTESSLAFRVAVIAQQEGARVVLSSFDRALSITRRVAQRLPEPAPVIEIDVTSPGHLAALPERVGAHVDTLDGVLHAIAFAPREALGENFSAVTWEPAATALRVSAWSLAGLTQACRPLFTGSASVVGLDFDAQVAWPMYGWMGVAKAALESSCRYLARQLGPQGVRVNLVAAGPVRTTAMRGIPGASAFEDAWKARAPLGWDSSATEPVGRACVLLLSDWLPATTGEIIHVDGGYHMVGA